MPTATPEAEAQSSRPRVGRLWVSATRPVPAQSVAAFRIGFGLLVTFSSLRFLAKGWVETLYLAPEHHLTYRWFEWIRPLPAALMYVVVAAVAFAGVAMAAGYRTRPAAAVFVVTFGYLELIEATLYLNHYWFMSLVGMLMVALPVDRHWSLDAEQQRVEPSPLVAAWVVWALRAQLAAVYVFAGIAKINHDWLVRAQPMTLWLADRTDTPIIGPLLGLPGVALGFSWAGMLFDCTIVGWLLWRRSRPLAYASLVLFHVVTGLLFQIGVFPLVMILLTLVFFAPDWPDRFVGRRKSDRSSSAEQPEVRGHHAPTTRRPIACLLIVFALVQIWLPLRHYVADSNVRWSEEGYLLAWRVMLTEKAGFVEFEVTDPSTGERWLVDAPLTDWQAAAVSTRPDLIHATALLIAEDEATLGRNEVEVRAYAWVAMNGRPAAQLIDADVDLAAHDRGRVPDGWILPAP